jgi:hypothetical protein
MNLRIGGQYKSGLVISKRKFHIPPDLVVKSQVIDIAEVI